MSKHGYVYIMSNKPNGTLYIGVTSNLQARIYQHKNKLVEGFTERYALDLLVYFECVETMFAAIAREKQLKNWRRAWKVELICRSNPGWRDLYADII